ncbi:FUN14 domain-containing protein 1B isoform X1 [Drosophila novamexicana]|uniref:FUN14 domain-containing protein 1B isoform X1 n=1 Tax=Drosophila novamexicana TaxID=47314 RepID=UPI0011E5F4B1|nr:FUN14 domain-containing protein 1B isoform X1 [Drosophila novamexicana]
MEGASKFLKGILGDISSRSAYSQIIIGVSSGWVTGYTTIKFGKFAAFAIGGSIILMEIAHQEGFIKIDWPKLSRSVDKIAEKVESSISPHDTNWLDKTERYLDRKLDKAEDKLKGKTIKVRKWYAKYIGDEEGPKINDLHIFITSFIGGIALGIATG